MTAAVYRGGTPSLAVPQTQNTALVLEFNCLYTHDVRRKQKRWQDGFLRFHTFNKRVMVYDVPRNFVGDTHWKEDVDLQDGDEVTLEKDGVLVQVTESVGRTQTDLTELRHSAKKRSSENGSSSPVRAAPNQALRPFSNATISKSITQLKHRSLNALLGAPKGPTGKAALPSKSPLEERAIDIDIENEVWEDGRPRKRQRMNEQSARNVTRTTTAAKPAVRNKPPLGARTAESASNEKKASVETGQQRLGTKSSDINGPYRFLPNFSSDALVPPSSPPKEQARTDKVPSVRSSSPAFQTQKAPEISRRQLRDEPAGRAGTNTISERPVSIERLVSATEVPQIRQQQKDTPRARESFADETDNKQEERTMNMHVGPAQSTRPPSSRSGKTLRMTATAPKKRTLLCQDQLPKKPTRMHSANTENAIESLLDATMDDTLSDKARPKSQRKQLQDRLARIRKRSAIDVDGNSAMDTPPPTEVDAILGQRPSTPPDQASSELNRLDEMILPPEQPEPPSNPVPSPTGVRQLRRVMSESNNPAACKPRRIPGAPVRITPSPAKVSPQAAQASAVEPANLQQQTTAGPSKARTKKSLQKSVSLNTTSNGTTTVILGRAFQASKPPKPKIVQPEQCANPWSREAFDLFTWRPPSWDEEKWCCKNVEA